MANTSLLVCRQFTLTILKCYVSYRYTNITFVSTPFTVCAVTLAVRYVVDNVATCLPYVDNVAIVAIVYQVQTV